MRLPEQRLWDRLSSTMSGYWCCHRIESRVQKSAPDVFFAHRSLSGWLELKVYSRPVRGTTRFSLGGWTSGQRAWAARFAANGSRVWLAVHFAGTPRVYLIAAPDAAAAVESLSVDEFERVFADRYVDWMDRDPALVLDRLREAWFNPRMVTAMGPGMLGAKPE